MVKRERYNPLTEKFEPVKKTKPSVKPLTHKEQFEPRRHPWQTKGWKKLKKSAKKSGKVLKSGDKRFWDYLDSTALAKQVRKKK